MSQIWKYGGIIERQENGQLNLTNSDNIPEKVLKAAEPIFSAIDSYLKSVEGMGNRDKTIWKMMIALAGWQKNESITAFLNGDAHALDLFFKYQTILAKNGWTNAYENWIDYENDESDKLKTEIYNRAVKFNKPSV